MTELYGKATAGVYAEVINQIYDSLDKRIREAVSNAFDAYATEVKISVYRQRVEPDRIVIRDNGHGMDDADLREKYICMGGGDNYNNSFTIGRIGIGALAVLALGDKITIHTRKKDTDQVITARLDLATIKSPELHAIPLDQVKLGQIESTRTAASSDEAHFTEIVVEDLSRSARNLFGDEEKTQGLISTLERILPIPYRSDDPVFGHVASDLRDAVVVANKYIIDVVLHIPHLELNNVKLRRRTVYSVEDVKVESLIPIYPFKGLEGAAKENLCVYGYLYISKAKAVPKDWQGINVRVKNVTIERNTWFGHERDAAARVRIGGELFIDNIDENKAIQSNRSGFAVENTDYCLIAKYMEEMIERAIAAVRRSDEVESAVKAVVVPLDKVRDMCEWVSKIEEGKPEAEGFQALTDNSVEVASPPRFLLEKRVKEVLQREVGVDPDVVWSPVLATAYYIEREDDDFYTVQLHERLRKFEFDVAGNRVEYILAHCGSENPPVVKKDRTIYFNLDNSLLPSKDIKKLDVGFLQVVLILYLNYLQCDGSAQDLYTKAINDLSQ